MARQKAIAESGLPCRTPYERVRFAGLLKEDTQQRCRMAREFEQSWKDMQQEVAADGGPGGGALGEPAAAAGTLRGKVLAKPQHELTAQRDQVEHDRVDEALRALPYTDTHRRAWLCLGECSSEFVASMPTSPNTTMGNEELRLAYEMYYDRPCALAVPLAAAQVRVGRHRQLMDVHGHIATSTAGKAALDWRHDEMKWLRAEYLRRAGIQHEVEVLGLFQHCVRQSDERQRHKQALVPDFKAKLRVDALPVLMDVKCITVCLSNHRRCLLRGRAGHPARRGEVVRRYAASVHGKYVTKARKFDRKHNSTTRGDTGPVETELRRWPRVRGLVFGAYGGVSADVSMLLRTCARAIAEKEWREGVGARTQEEAYAGLITKMRREVGVLAVRSHSVLKLKRLREIAATVGGGAVSRAAREAGARAAASRRAASRRAHANAAEVYHAVHSNARTMVGAALRQIWARRLWGASGEPQHNGGGSAGGALGDGNPSDGVSGSVSS